MTIGAFKLPAIRTRYFDRGRFVLQRQAAPGVLRRKLPYVANRVFAGFRSHVLIGYAAALRAPVFRVLEIVECDLPFMARCTFHGHLSMGTAGISKQLIAGRFDNCAGVLFADFLAGQTFRAPALFIDVVCWPGFPNVTIGASVTQGVMYPSILARKALPAVFCGIGFAPFEIVNLLCHRFNVPFGFAGKRND